MTTTLHHHKSTADMCRMEEAYGMEGGTVNDAEVIMRGRQHLFSFV